ncbi:MAG: DUF488 family protein [Elusimicrobia bacterium]|nr:DUF488 family protein [Elusimicrobiota bacterium]
MLRIKRVYEPPARGDGARVLVDRLWPRGLTKARARIDAWLKEVAPSGALRRWFHEAPRDWEDFVARYRAELAGQDALLDELRRREKERGTLTLLFASRDPTRNNAAALLEILRGQARRPAARAKTNKQV